MHRGINRFLKPGVVKKPTGKDALYSDFALTKTQKREKPWKGKFARPSIKSNIAPALLQVMGEISLEFPVYLFRTGFAFDKKWYFRSIR
jgi:hypothetical protein